MREASTAKPQGGWCWTSVRERKRFCSGLDLDGATETVELSTDLRTHKGTRSLNCILRVSFRLIVRAWTWPYVCRIKTLDHDDLYFYHQTAVLDSFCQDLVLEPSSSSTSTLKLSINLNFREFSFQAFVLQYFRISLFSGSGLSYVIPIYVSSLSLVFKF